VFECLIRSLEVQFKFWYVHCCSSYFHFIVSRFLFTFHHSCIIFCVPWFIWLHCS